MKISVREASSLGPSEVGHGDSETLTVAGIVFSLNKINNTKLDSTVLRRSLKPIETSAPSAPWQLISLQCVTKNMLMKSKRLWAFRRRSRIVEGKFLCHDINHLWPAHEKFTCNLTIKFCYYTCLDRAAASATTLKRKVL